MYFFSWKEASHTKNLVTYVLINLFIPGHYWRKVIYQTYYSPMVTNRCIVVSLVVKSMTLLYAIRTYTVIMHLKKKRTHKFRNANFKKGSLSKNRFYFDPIPNLYVMHFLRFEQIN